MTKSINSFDANPHSDRVQITKVCIIMCEKCENIRIWKSSLFSFYQRLYSYSTCLTYNALSIAVNNGRIYKFKMFYINYFVKTFKTHRLRHSPRSFTFFYIMCFFISRMILTINKFFSLKNKNKLIFVMKMHFVYSEVGNEV